jgi:succinate dehydrogenase / fumarate reductase cytochrome b subunit
LPTHSRPLSPHLSIYRFTLTMTMSILHRATGIALYAGMFLLVLWLFAAALGGGVFAGVNIVYSSWFGQFVLFCYTWVLFHHLLGGIRHFIWDSIHGFDPPDRENLARANIIGSVALTIIAWVLFVWLRG